MGMRSPKRRRIIILAVVGAVLLFVAFKRPWRSEVPLVVQSPPGSTPANPAAGEAPTGSATGTAAKKAKPPLDLPRSLSLPGTWERQDMFIKPGHWTSIWVEGESNGSDYFGTLSAEITGADGQLLQLTPQRRRLDTDRRVVFPDGDQRVAEQWVYTPNYYDRVAGDRAVNRQPPQMRSFPRRLPPSQPQQPQFTVGESTLRGASLNLQLARGAGEAVEYRSKKQTFALRNHQSLFVVLAARPSDYKSFARLQIIRATPADDSLPPDQSSHYRFINADDPLRAPLASHFAGWTTTAFLVWDGYDPAALSEEQRRAIVDWLHWGGRMLVVGPSSLAQLDRSFLAPYLPAKSLGSKQLEADDLAALDDWTIGTLAPQRARPWPGVQLRPNDQGEAILGGRDGAPPLVVERQVGRGRIVVTAFELTQPGLTEWPSFDGFLNGCLLGRSARQWTDFRGRFDGGDVQQPAWRKNPSTSWYDPHEINDIRYAARDTSRNEQAPPNSYVGPGTAAWRDDGPAAEAARRMLQEEAGIVIPSAGVVVAIIGTYLLVLVPINGLIFYWIRKVEWAWFAAPLIAVAFAAIVIRVAQLDIGFARSMSEVAIVELQPGYSRAHVSRFGAVYNSLGTDYALISDEPTTVMLPFAPALALGVGPEGSIRLSRSDTAEGGASQVRLNDFLVESNSTSMYRTEQMADMGGSLKFELLSLDRARLTNDTSLALEDVKLTGSFTGSASLLAPHSSIEIERSAGSDAPKPSGTNARPLAREDLDNAVQALDGASLRLVAWSSSIVPGLTLEPTPSQQRRKTIVVANLAYAALVRARDANIPTPPPQVDLDAP